MGEKIILILTVFFAFAAVETTKLNRSVIYLGIFSLLCSVIYLLYQSPNIAIAEAVIGSTLSTVIFLVALRKQKRFTVYVKNTTPYQLLDYIESFCEKEDLILHYIRLKDKAFERILNSGDFDLMIDGTDEDIFLISSGTNYKVEKLASGLAKDERFSLNVSLHEMRESNELE